MRKTWALALAAMLAAGALLTPYGKTRAAPSVLVFGDHFTNLNWTDAALTTASVDTVGTGVIRLPKGVSAGSVALRPNGKSLVAKGQDSVTGFSFDGTAMRPDPRLTFSLPSVVSVAFSSDGGLLFAASGSEVRVYAFDSAGRAVEMPLVRVSGLSGVLAVEAGRDRDFWVLTRGAATYYAWDGFRYWPVWIIALGQGKALSFNEPRNSLAVVDGDAVRYFAFNGSAYTEVPYLRTNIPGASSVAQVRGGGGYRVQTGNATVYAGLTGSGIVQYSRLADTPGADVIMIAESPWGDFDYAALTSTGIQYRAFDGTGYRTNGGLSAFGAIGGPASGYSGSALYVSTVIPAAAPVEKVRIVASESVPGGAGTSYAVSTDGGSTWTLVPPGANTAVPPGNRLVYRITLSTADPRVTPEIDEVELLQIVTQTLTARNAWGQPARVRLVK